MSGARQPIPPTEASPRRARPPERVLWGLVGLGALAVLTLAMTLAPSDEGHGTHTRLGLPPCGWAVVLDKPCPTCGMTTAFSHAAKGDLLTALRTQPMGLVLVVGAATAFWTGAHAATTGARVGPALALFNRKWAYAVLGGAFLAAWVYKILAWGG